MSESDEPQLYLVAINFTQKIAQETSSITDRKFYRQAFLKNSSEDIVWYWRCGWWLAGGESVHIQQGNGPLLMAGHGIIKITGIPRLLIFLPWQES